MAKKTISFSLSRGSFEKAIREINTFKKEYKNAVNLGVEKATKRLYELVINNCRDVGITIHDANIHWEYDRNTNVGRVWTNDIVIIFNEFGTGIRGTQDDWATQLGYNVNESGKGETGWRFYNIEHNYGGITHGINSRHMFYNALKTLENELSSDINIYVKRVFK